MSSTISMERSNMSQAMPKRPSQTYMLNIPTRQWEQIETTNTNNAQMPQTNPSIFWLELYKPQIGTMGLRRCGDKTRILFQAHFEHYHLPTDQVPERSLPLSDSQFFHLQNKKTISVNPLRPRD